MSVPLGPEKSELTELLRERVDRYRGATAPADEPAGDEPAGDDGSSAAPPAEPVASPAEPAEPAGSGATQAGGTPVGASAASTPDNDHEVFSMGTAFGGSAGLVDAGLPSIVFIGTYTLSGSNLRLAIILAVSCGAVLAILRLARRQSVQHAVGGFLGVALAAYIASRSGKAEDFYLPGLFINGGYALAYAVSILVRWPLIGLLVAALQQKDLSAWRRDPVLLRAYSRASWLWVGMFAVRLAVQLPLYLAGAAVPLGIARVAMGWPLFILTAWLTYLTIKASVPAGYRVTKLARPEPKTAPTEQ